MKKAHYKKSIIALLVVLMYLLIAVSFAKILPLAVLQDLTNSNIKRRILYDAKTKLRELAGFLGIENRLKHLPSELSGGQKQRVAIARALINDPVIFLADEPTGNLDKKAADEIMELLLAVNRRGNTVLLVTHEQRYADLCGRKIEISDGKI